MQLGVRWYNHTYCILKLSLNKKSLSKSLTLCLRRGRKNKEPGVADAVFPGEAAPV